MSLTPAQFSRRVTTTPGKLGVINTQIAEVNKRFNPRHLKGYCVGMPGSGKQAARHVEEYKAYGIPEYRQVMVDYNLSVTKNQRYHLGKVNFAGTVSCGNIVNVLNKMWNDNHHVSTIDCDDVGHFEPWHEELITKAASKDVKVFVLVLTTRANSLSPFLSAWKKKLGLRKRFVKKTKKWSEPIADIQEGAVRHIADKLGYDVVSTRYKGLSPMISLLLLKR